MKYPQAGCKIVIYWKDFDDVDYGYLYQTQKMDVDSFMVHVPNPSNPGGKDSVPPVWIRLDKLLRNNNVKRIKYKL